MEKGKIKVSELRIGNLVYDIEDGNYYEIESIYLKGDSNVYWVSYRDGSIKCRVDALEPIVLTEEWLLRFGFEGSEIFKNSYILNSVEIYIQDGLYWYDFGNDRVEIKYVHSLQNLVHALTNEELTIKENGK